jgi:PspA-Associated protein
MKRDKPIKKEIKGKKKTAIALSGKGQKTRNNSSKKLQKTATVSKKRSAIKGKKIQKPNKNKNNNKALKTDIKRKAVLSKKTKTTTKGGSKATKPKKVTAFAEPSRRTKIVRIMGEGQFTVDNNTLKKLNEIDNSIVQLVSNERSDDREFRNRLTELTNIVEKNGKPLESKEIIQSDIILPSTDLSIDEAKKLFKNEGVIPEII